mmetsp:Transcript_46766/g.133659  ORF Transcript_46766/g.133659 Transcript_46766/m.133659 type:complete len:235 (-) Transcript_46766:100-804(-)
MLRDIQRRTHRMIWLRQLLGESVHDTHVEVPVDPVKIDRERLADKEGHHTHGEGRVHQVRREPSALSSLARLQAESQLRNDKHARASAECRRRIPRGTAECRRRIRVGVRTSRLPELPRTDYQQLRWVVAAHDLLMPCKEHMWQPGHHVCNSWHIDGAAENHVRSGDSDHVQVVSRNAVQPGDLPPQQRHSTVLLTRAIRVVDYYVCEVGAGPSAVQFLGHIADDRLHGLPNLH